MAKNEFWQAHRVSQDPRKKPSTMQSSDSLRQASKTHVDSAFQAPLHARKEHETHMDRAESAKAKADSMDQAHLGQLSRGVRKYVYKRNMEGTKPTPKAASDNTRVTPRKKK